MKPLQFEHAEHSLEIIRTLMERSQRYEHISGHSGLVAGSAALAGCAVLTKPAWLPLAPKVGFLAVWSVVFVVAATAQIALAFAKARQRGEPAWSRQARTVLLALLPCFLASLAMSVLMWRLDRLDLLPALWLMLYGSGTMATSFFAPRSILVLGATCFVLGGLSLMFLPGWPLLTMAAGFGLTHLGFGACVLVNEWNERRELSQIMSWEQNSPT